MISTVRHCAERTQFLGVKLCAPPDRCRPACCFPSRQLKLSASSPVFSHHSPPRHASHRHVQEGCITSRYVWSGFFFGSSAHHHRHTAVFVPLTTHPLLLPTFIYTHATRRYIRAYQTPPACPPFGICFALQPSSIRVQPRR